MRSISFRKYAPVAGGIMVIGLIALLAANPRAREPWGHFWYGVAGNATLLGATLSLASPILLCAFGSLLPFRAGVFSLGQPGQYLLGALATAIVTSAVPGPDVLAIVLGLLAGMVMGAAWSLVNALAVRLEVDVLVVSLMLNYIAIGLATFVSGRVLRDPGSPGIFATPRLPKGRTLVTLIPGSSFHVGIIISVVVSAIVVILLHYFVFGHRLRLFGLNPSAGQFAGTPRDGIYAKSFALGGALCGLAGGLQALGILGRYVDGALSSSSSPAWTGIIVAAVAGLGNVVLVPIALAFAMLSTGLAGFERGTGLSSTITLLLQAIIITAAAALRRGKRLPSPVRLKRTASVAVRAESTDQGEPA